MRKKDSRELRRVGWGRGWTSWWGTGEARHPSIPTERLVGIVQGRRKGTQNVARLWRGRDVRVEVDKLRWRGQKWGRFLEPSVRHVLPLRAGLRSFPFRRNHARYPRNRDFSPAVKRQSSRNTLTAECTNCYNDGRSCTVTNKSSGMGANVLYVRSTQVSRRT